MNRTPQEKFVLLFETVKRSLLAADFLLRRISEELRVLEADIDQQIDVEDRAIPPLLSAVAFIDFAHRFGSVADALPLVKKDAPEMRRLENALEQVERARNHLQHMRGDLSSNAEIDYPLLGSLSWSNGARGYTISLSQPTRVDVFSLVYDLYNQTWVAQHQYTVKDSTIDLDLILNEMRSTYDWIISKIQFSEPDFAELRWGKTRSMWYEIQQNTPTVDRPNIPPTADT